jgi:DNA (cytosine-5)-methyltransferase 1
MARIIGEVRPRFAFVENSPMLTSRGLGRVLGDLSEMGFDALWGVVSACQLGAPHSRERLFLVAHNHEDFVRTSRPTKKKAAPARLHKHGVSPPRQMATAWQIQREPCSLDDGLPGLVDQLRPYGNAQVPLVAALAWQILTSGDGKDS